MTIRVDQISPASKSGYSIQYDGRVKWNRSDAFTVSKNPVNFVVDNNVGTFIKSFSDQGVGDIISGIDMSSGIDGYTPTAYNEEVLVTGRSSAYQNGIYTIAPYIEGTIAFTNLGPNDGYQDDTNSCDPTIVPGSKFKINDDIIQHYIELTSRTSVSNVNTQFVGNGDQLIISVMASDPVTISFLPSSLLQVINKLNSTKAFTDYGLVAAQYFDGTNYRLRIISKTYNLVTIHSGTSASFGYGVSVYDRVSVKQLIRRIADTDVRCSLYVTPTNEIGLCSESGILNLANVTPNTLQSIGITPQNTPVYDPANTVIIRTSSSDTKDKLMFGSSVSVRYGTLYGGKKFLMIQGTELDFTTISCTWSQVDIGVVTQIKDEIVLVSNHGLGDGNLVLNNILSLSPNLISPVEVVYGPIHLDNGFSISGRTLTLDPVEIGFPFEIGDVVTVYYYT